MSRYSLPWLKSDEVAADSASRKSAKSTTAFFYPPLTPTPPVPSKKDMSEPLVPSSSRSPPPLPPHPYQAYSPESYDYLTTPPTNTNTIPNTSHTQLHPGSHPGRAVSTTTASTDGEPDKATNTPPTYVVHHHHHHHHTPPAVRDSLPPIARTPGVSIRISPRRVLSKFKPLVLLVLFLPIPPLLSVLYMVIGHSILRRALHSHSWAPPLISSANAGAAGGAILSLPLFLALFILLYPSPKAASPTRAANEDFFEDDDSSHAAGTQQATSLATYVTSVAIFLGVGAAAGPLGVTCLGKDGRPAMLLPGKAAEAGAVGGVILWGGVLVVSAIAAMSLAASKKITRPSFESKS